ncbi:MAG: heparinase II/III family protein [Armatimonadetes bacterium]|nr:heparinase II/III family protein [Armatimonadota bacterium]
MSASKLGWMILVGWSAALPAVSAAEPDVVWPTEWAAFGPAPTPRRMGPYGTPDKADLVAGNELKAIPTALTIGDQTFPARKLSVDGGLLDLRQKMGGAGRGKNVYLMAPITVARDMTIQIGAGADWWMHWWVDGRPVYDTLRNGQNGNGTAPITNRDHVFEVALARGTHVLAVAVFSAPYDFALALASPQELRDAPLGFREMMDAGKRKSSESRKVAYIDFAAAGADFQRALAVATEDADKAEAHLAIAANRLMDVGESDMAAIREHCAAVLALAGARPEQKARAERDTGETWLRENRCAPARESFARALALSSQPGWAPAVHLAVARSYAQERNNDAAQQELARLTGVADLDPLLAFQARSLTAALSVAPRVRADHPRLFFNADTWPAVKARIAASPEALGRLTRQAAELPETAPTRDWGRELMPAALLYRVTGDAALLDKIGRLLRATMDAYLSRQDYNSHVESRVGCISALDWVWNDLPPAERDGLARDLLRYVYGQYTEDVLKGAREVDHDPYYYSPAMYWYAGLVLLHPGQDPVDYARVLTALGRGYDNNVVAGFDRRLKLIAQDSGEVASGPDYSFNDLPTPTWSFLHCWQSAVGPVPEEWAYASGIFPEYVLRAVLGFRGGRYRHFGYSKAWRPNGGWQGASLLYSNLRQFIHFFTKTHPEDAAIAAYLCEQMAEAGCRGEGSYPVYAFLLDPAAAPAPKVPENLPLAHHYSINNRVLMSSGFGADATYALFSCGTTPGQSPTHTPSQHFDAGHFTLFKKGYLALDSGSRALGQDTMPDQSASGINYDSQSVAHNTVLIRMEGEVMPPMWRKPVVANTGGQCRLPTDATVLAFETDPRFAYAATDATGTYHEEKCARMVRQLLFLAPDHFVVFDRVISKNPAYPKSWLLHMGREPVFTGKEFRADQEEGRLFCRTLYPLDAVLEAVGGPGREFWADGRNWPIPADSPYLGAINTDHPDHVPENIGRWRVEVKPGAARTEDCFLHLIQVSDQTVQTMVESRVSEAGGQIEVAFTAGVRAYTIRLNKAGDIGGHIRIEEGGRTVVDKDLARGLR